GRGGGRPEGFVPALLDALLGQKVSPAELAGTVDPKLSKPSARGKLANRLLGGLGEEVLIDRYARRFLGRPTEGGEKDDWLRALRHSRHDEHLLAAILGS